ncbi:MAG: recombinase family protein, partial [Candidatus Gastranaerophilales bacterium]|nr:recombinase family protein [Candidatus Gastranaerophilales bacterium]
MEKAVIYVRVSSEEQAKHGFSIENQKKVCIEFAEKQGYFVDKVFVDEGKSAKNLDRPEIQELMVYCGKKKNDTKVVVIWRLDRISRNNTDYHGVIRPLFAKKGIQLLSATESNVDTMEGELMRNIGMSFAEYERKVIGARTLAGLKQKARQGECPYKAPIGYKNISREDGSKTVVIDEANAFYVKQAFNLYDSGMYSLRSLTAKLYEDGFRTPKGNKVPKASIEHILKNIFYAGVFKYDGQIYENAKHAAIISKDLFYRVQDRLISPQKAKKQNYEFAYTGMIRCEYCDCLLTAELKKGKYVYYHCTGNRGGECKRDYINEIKIDKSISEVLKLIILPQDIRAKISKKLKSVHEKKCGYSKETKANIQQQITKLESRIEKLFQEKLDNVITFDEWKKYNEKWHIEKDKLCIQLEEINKLDKSFYEQADTLLGFMDNAHDYFLKGSLAQKRKVVEIISEKISYKDKVFNLKLKPIFQTIV